MSNDVLVTYESLNYKTTYPSGLVVEGHTRVPRSTLFSSRSLGPKTPKPPIGAHKPAKPYSRFVDFRDWPKGRNTTRDPANRVTEWWGSFAEFIYAETHGTTSGSYLHRRALEQALSRLKDQKVNFAVAMLEARETAGLLISVCTKVAKARNLWNMGRKQPTRFLAKRYWREAANILEIEYPGRFADHWNAYQYGVMPLVNDVKGSVESLLLTGAVETNWQITTKGKARDRISSRLDYPGSNGFSFIGLRDEELGCDVRLDFRPTPWFMSHFLASSGLLNVPAAAYELIPYSFVVDYFWNIGGWLNSLDAAYGLQFWDGSYTVKELMLEKWVNAPDDNSLGASSQGHRRRLNMYRVPYGGMPLLDFPPPGLDNFLQDKQKLLNALNLLWGSNHSGRPPRV